MNLAILSDINPVKLALEGVLPSIVAAVVVLGLALRIWRPDTRLGDHEAAAPVGPRVGPQGGMTWGAPLAIGVGFFASYVGIHGLPPLDWYPDMKARLAWVALAAAAFGVLRARSVHPKPWGNVCFFALASLYLLSHWSLRGHWPWTATLIWVVAATLTCTLQWFCLEKLATRLSGAGLSLCLCLCAGLASRSFFLAHAESHARMASGIAATLGVAAVFGLRRRNLALSRTGIATFVLLYTGLGLANHLTADLPPAALALILAAPVTLFLLELPALRGTKTWVRLVLGLVLVLIPVAYAAEITGDANPAYGADDYMRSLGQ
ncbi:MAG: hypothetical protein ACI9K5_001006 [Gammaproteobacteria bacterium]